MFSTKMSTPPSLTSEQFELRGGVWQFMGKPTTGIYQKYVYNQQSESYELQSGSYEFR